MAELLRNMVRRKMRTGLTVLGIVVGVFALTVMGGLSEYFNTMLDGAIKFSGSTIPISPSSRAAEARLNETTIRQLERVAGVKAVIRVLGDLLADEMSAVQFGPPEQVLAIEPEYATVVYQGVKMQQGRWLQRGDAYQMVVGSKVAAAHHLSLGDSLEWRKKQFAVVGILEGTNSFPDQTVIVNYEIARRVMKLSPDVIGGLSVLPQEGADPEDLTKRINQQVKAVTAKSPRQVIEEVRQGMLIFNVIMLSGALLAAIVGGLSVVNTMIMSVNERTKEIGIKKAVGASNRDVVTEYVSEAALIGLAGGLIGLTLGYLMTMLLNAAAAPSLGGTNLWVVTPRLAIIVLVFATGLGAVAGLYPALSAARLDPVRALRSE